MTTLDTTATAAPRAQAWRVALLLFGSGCAALIYQTAWMREFRLIFGASTAASAAVLAIFVGGLGLGGLRARPARRPAPAPHPLLLAPRSDRGRFGGAHAVGAGGRAVDLFLDGRHAEPRHGRRNHPAPAAQHGGARRADLCHGRHAAGRGPRRHPRQRRPPAGRRRVVRTQHARRRGRLRGVDVLPSRDLRHAQHPVAGCGPQRDRRRSRAPGRSELGRDRAGTARGAGRRRGAGAGADLVPARRVRRGRVRVLPDGAGLVSHAGAAPRRIGLHLRADSLGGARRHRDRRPAVLADRSQPAGVAHRPRHLVSPRGGRDCARVRAGRSHRGARAGADAAGSGGVRRADRGLDDRRRHRRAARRDHFRLSVPAADRAVRPRPRQRRTADRPGVRREYGRRDRRLAGGRVPGAAAPVHARRVAIRGTVPRGARDRRGGVVGFGPPEGGHSATASA